MQPSQNREVDVRRMGAQLEASVAADHEAATAIFNRLLGLRRSEIAHLGDAVVSICEGRLAQGDSVKRDRLFDFGATATRYFALAFDHDLINDRLVPALINMSRNLKGRPSESLTERRSRYEKISALGQLAPIMDEERVDEALEACLEFARESAGFVPDLLLPLSAFERSFRDQGAFDEESIRSRAQQVCLRAIASVLQGTIDSITEVDGDSLSDITVFFPLAQSASLAWLNIVASVRNVEDERCQRKVEEILDSSQWLLTRCEGFPGNYFKPKEIDKFDQVRSALSLAAGALCLHSPEHREIVSGMRIAGRKGPHRIGTKVLEMARGAKGEEDIEFIRQIAAAGLRTEGANSLNDVSRDVLVEVCAFAWHMNLGDSPFVRAAVEVVRDPFGQFYLSKTLEGGPWE